MKARTRVALVGIGGYGSNYVAGFLDGKDYTDVELIAVVDPFPAACPRLDELRAFGIPHYAALEPMYEAHQPDLVVISSPIHVHCEQTVTALRHGSHVLCEKPLCATLNQIDQMIAARDLAKRQVGIGYQWPFSATFQSLKGDISRGMLGAPVRLSTLVCWPRDNRYYGRNRWAGRKFDDAGHPVYDSPVNNACAHYLQIMLYILGSQVDRSVSTRDVVAELYRANDIENYDTAALRCTTASGAQILFLTSHATAEIRGPVFRYEFEKAVVTFDSHSGEGVVAHFSDGTIVNYGSASSGIGKMWMTIDAIRSGRPVSCGIEAAAEQTRVMVAAQQNEIVPFPSSIVHVQERGDGCSSVAVDGLEDCLLECYREHKLPSELGISWAIPKALTVTARG